MMTETSDPTLQTIHRALRGDETALRALYEAHYPAAFRLACLLLQNTRDAEEVVQDALAYALRHLYRYDPERGAFQTWLRVILVSRCHNKRRRRSLALVSLDALTEVGRAPAASREAHDPAEILALRGAQRAIWEALQAVSPGARDALVLRFYEGLAYREIGLILNCSPAAARARVAHGKKQLRRLLEEAREEWGAVLPVSRSRGGAG
jgi:RNA polymerase sigma-70 factor (ECF subfamily)